jgi:hypothetical protein
LTLLVVDGRWAISEGRGEMGRWGDWRIGRIKRLSEKPDSFLAVNFSK